MNPPSGPARTTRDEPEVAALPLGDPEDWLRVYGDLVLRFARSRIADQRVAEDLAQETFLAAWNSREKFRGECSVRSWLIAILKHKIYDYQTKHGKEYVFTDLLDNGSDHDPDLLLQGCSANLGQESRISDLERKEIFQTFLRCTNSLPSRLKEVALLAEVDGLSGREIAAKLSLTSLNARQILSRARKLLRECMKQLLGNDTP